MNKATKGLLSFSRQVPPQPFSLTIVCSNIVPETSNGKSKITYVNKNNQQKLGQEKRFRVKKHHIHVHINQIIITEQQTSIGSLMQVHQVWIRMLETRLYVRKLLQVNYKRTEVTRWLLKRITTFQCLHFSFFLFHKKQDGNLA